MEMKLKVHWPDHPGDFGHGKVEAGSGIFVALGTSPGGMDGMILVRLGNGKLGWVSWDTISFSEWVDLES